MLLSSARTPENACARNPCMVGGQNGWFPHRTFLAFLRPTQAKTASTNMLQGKSWIQALSAWSSFCFCRNSRTNLGATQNRAWNMHAHAKQQKHVQT